MYQELTHFPEQEKATSWQFFWMCCLIMAFSYEVPLASITPYYRMNPKVYDIVLFLGILTVIPSLRTASFIPSLYKIWKFIVIIFVACALIWCLWIPFQYAKYSLFFAFKYLMQLLIMFMVLRIPLSEKQKHILHYLIVLGGIIVATFAIPDYLRGGSTRVISESSGIVLEAYGNRLFSCLGPSYFHVALFSSLAMSMALVLLKTVKSFMGKILTIVLAIYIGWPAFFSGSRTGIVAGAFVLLGLGFHFLKHAKPLIIFFVIIVVFLFILDVPGMVVSQLAKVSPSFERMAALQEKGDSQDIWSRFSLNWYDWTAYRWQGLRIPFIGAGFYVAPLTQPGGGLYYRVGYGIHNSYLFALEQGGLSVFVLFIAFLVSAWKSMKAPFLYTNSTDESFVVGFRAFFLAMIVLGFANMPFFLSDSIENFNTFWLVLIILAVRPTNSMNYFYQSDHEKFYETDYYPDNIQNNYVHDLYGEIA